MTFHLTIIIILRLIIWHNRAVEVLLMHNAYLYVSVNLRFYRKVQVGNDQEKAQSEKYSHSKNRGGEKTKLRY